MNTLDNLLRRLTKTSKDGASQPCRICNNPTEATDLCDKCIKDELMSCETKENVEVLFTSMIELRECNKKLDFIEARLGEMKNART